jgi:nucleoside-diphosphate-sugar epimerase
MLLVILLILVTAQNMLADPELSESQANMKSVTTTLVIGATGATGRHVVQMLLDRGQKVRTIARSKERMEMLLEGDFGDRLIISEASILDLSQSKLDELTSGCDAVVSCLGHIPDFKGIWGEPRKLVTEAVISLTTSIGSQKTKFILMSADGVANPNGNDDRRPFLERLTLTLLRLLIPPVADNEAAALYVHSLGKDTSIEWCVVRPGDLIEGDVSEYNMTPKPCFGLFGAGKSTRANVGHSMVQLILNDDEWEKWKFQMPVLTNAINSKEEK